MVYSWQQIFAIQAPTSSHEPADENDIKGTENPRSHREVCLLGTHSIQGLCYDVHESVSTNGRDRMVPRDDRRCMASGSPTSTMAYPSRSSAKD
ncbi:hypothetical protein COP2_022595 [Malus domestica]